MYYRYMNYTSDTLERSLGPKQATLLLSLAERFGTSFTTEQARSLARKDDGALTRSLHELTAKGWLFSLGRGAYMIAPLEAGPDSASYAVNRYLAAATIAGDRPYYVSYRSAMEIHGMTVHPWRTVYVSTPARLRTRTIQSFTIQPVTVKPERLWGWSTSEVLPDHRVRVSTPERTIVDGLDMPMYAGGIGDVYLALSLARETLDPKRLVDDVLRLNKVSVIKRAGVLLQLSGLASEDLLRPLADRVDRTPHVLDPQQPRSGQLDSRWKIWMNVSSDVLQEAEES